MAQPLTAWEPPVAAPATSQPLESIEIDLLLEGISRHYGYDFRGFSRASLERRILARLRREGLTTVSALQALVLHDSASLHRLMRVMAVPTTSLFREPELFAAVRQDVVPWLRTWPSLRIWLAGCATGEEAYSMAILLEEEGLLPRSRVHATDVNPDLLVAARSGEVSSDKLVAARRAHADAGGRRPLEEHFTATGTRWRLRPQLLGRITWNQHDLVTDASFNEFHLIICANVLIYFTKLFQDRIQRLLYDSLLPFGFLGLGQRELIILSPHAGCYVPVPPTGRLLKKVR